MLRRAHHFLATLLALSLYGSSAATATLVICVGSGGHVAVESVSAACCLPSAAPNSPSVSEPAACDGCSDYSLVVTGEARKGSAPYSMWAMESAAATNTGISSRSGTEGLTGVRLAPVPPVFTLRC